QQPGSLTHLLTACSLANVILYTKTDKHVHTNTQRPIELYLLSHTHTHTHTLTHTHTHTVYIYTVYIHVYIHPYECTAQTKIHTSLSSIKHSHRLVLKM